MTTEYTGYAIKFPDGTFLNHTCKVGPYWGKLSKTAKVNNPSMTRRWTREKDAKSMLRTLLFKKQMYTEFQERYPDKNEYYKQQIKNIEGVEKTEVIRI